MSSHARTDLNRNKGTRYRLRSAKSEQRADTRTDEERVRVEARSKKERKEGIKKVRKKKEGKG
jgi:hypothetical protein